MPFIHGRYSRKNLLLASVLALPGAYFLMGLSALFLLSGGYFLFKAVKGPLHPQGKTVTDVRLAAVEKMDSAELLGRIAREDPVADVREKAMARLEEIAA